MQITVDLPDDIARHSNAQAAKDVSKFGADTPMKRPAEPEEIAPAYVFLATPRSPKIETRTGREPSMLEIKLGACR